MNKVLENSKKFLTILLVAAIAFIAVTFSTKAVTNTLVLGDAQDLPAYIGGVTFATKQTTDGKYLYCLEMEKTTTMHTTVTLTGERDAGIAYIVLNGFPNKTITGDNSQDYYITQTAIWWYLDETTGSMNLGEFFKEEGEDQYNLRPLVKALVQGGLAAREAGYQSSSVTVTAADNQLYNNGDYYVSNEIVVSTSSSNYSVSLEGATANTITTNTSGEAKTTFNAGENFIVKVPTAEINDTSLSIKVNVTSNGVVYKAYEYSPENPEMQKVTPGIIEPTEEVVTTSIDLSLITTKVVVTKFDSVTNNPLAGAKLVLKDSDGEVITRWTSTTNSHVIRNLTVGTYTVSEEEAPVGYEKSNDVVTFTLTAQNNIVNVKFYNNPKEETVVNITKIDSETGNALAGAEMLITDAKGNEVARFITTEESYVITGLAYGTYYLSEVSAPAGYKVSDEVIDFVLDDDHISYQIKFANYKEVPVPNTSTSDLLFTIIGIALIGSSIGFIYKNAKEAK